MRSLILLLLTATAFAQTAVRNDTPLLTSGPNVPISGGPLPQALWLANAKVTVCQHPSTANSCTPAVTYTDSTEATQCPPSAPLTQLPGTICTASTGALANAGFWYGGGLVDFYVYSSYGTKGPYTVSGGSGSTSPVVQSINGAHGAFIFTGSGVSCISTTCTITSGSGTPGGTTGQIQYNAAGAFAGAATLNAAGYLNASVNTQVNVTLFGAVGDGSTDDTPAFCTAQTAAETYAVGNSLPAAIYLPKPPGGSYVVSMDNHTVGGNPTCYWQGVSIEGQPSGLGPDSAPLNYGVTLKGIPGHDVLYVPDPSLTTGTITVYPGWSLRNLGIMVMNTVSATFPHRNPGRWFDDAVCTASSNIISTSNGSVTPGDVGQAIQLNGCGSGGSNLVTTITGVSPAWRTGDLNWQVITIGTNALTSATAVHTYISLLGLPVTARIGPCGIAADLYDGLTTNWTATNNVGNYGKMENVVFVNYGQMNNSCGVFIQGQPLLYGVDVQNYAVYGGSADYGIIQTTTELNSNRQPSSGDLEKWDHGAFLNLFNPWISVNGLGQRITHTQVTAASGFQANQVGDYPGDAASGWILDHSFECPFGTPLYGDHITGSLHQVQAGLTCGSGTQNGWFDAESSTCTFCNLTNTQINGYANVIDRANVTTGMTNNGQGNVITAGYVASPVNGIPPNSQVALAPYKGANVIGNRYTADFLRDGNFTTPYNQDDLFYFPNDLIFSDSTPWSSIIVPDSTSPTGYYASIANNIRFQEFAPQVANGSTSGAVTIGTGTKGTFIPDTGATLDAMIKCASGTTSFTLQINASGGTAATASETCTTSYQYYSLPITWVSGDVGKIVQIGAAFGSNMFRAAWMAVVPTAVVAGNTTTLCFGTVTLSGTVPNGVQQSVGTASCPNLATTDTVITTFNTNIFTITGYSPSTSGTLTCAVQPTANTVGVNCENNTPSPLTIGSGAVLNYRVVR